jgi:hypothetical protein
MHRLVGARVLHPTAVRMRPMYEDVARMRAFSMGAMRFFIF